MTDFISITDGADAGVLDAITGNVAVIAGLDKPDAAATFAAYQAASSRAAATWDGVALTVTDGTTLIQFFWETSISWNQDSAWTTVWTDLFVSNHLAPSGELTSAFEGIISAGFVPG